MKVMIVPGLLLLLASCSAVQEPERGFAQGKTFQLASPNCTVDSMLFLKAATLSLELDYPGVEIFYTDDGSIPTPASRLYSGPVRVGASKTITARAFHPDFLPSEAVSRQFRKLNASTGNAKVELRPEAHASYPGDGPQTLADRQKGSLNFRNGHFWMGFQADTIDISLALDDEVAIGSVTLSVLEDNGAWIFLPRRIEVYIQGEMAGSEEWPAAKEAGPPSMHFLEVPVSGARTDNIQVKVINWVDIPDWHPGKGTPPWFFTDELLIN